MPSIVYANTIDYNNPLQQRPHHIMNSLAKRGWEVHWVNATKEEGVRPDRFGSLTVWHSFSQFVKRVPSVDVHFISWAARYEDISFVNSEIVCYDSLDLFPENEHNEKKMVSEADIIFATTNNIFEYQRAHTDKPIYLCENGCFDSFRDRELNIPEEFKKLPKPWVLFSGALAIEATKGWVNGEIIKAISERYSTFVVGDVWGWWTKASIEEARKTLLPNVNFLGYKKYEDLQAYYKWADVNIVPFKRCQTADYSSPLKLVEGCNMGTVCISSDIPVSCELSFRYPKAVLIAKTAQEFIDAVPIAKSLKDNKDCFLLADKNTWDKKVDIIETGLLKSLKGVTK